MIRENEEDFNEKFKSLDQDQKARTQSMWSEVEKLKESIKQELMAKTQQLDLEYEELESQKIKQREALK